MRITILSVPLSILLLTTSTIKAEFHFSDMFKDMKEATVSMQKNGKERVISKDEDYIKYIDFSHIYPKSIWQKSYFTWLVMGSTIIVAGAVSYFSGGAGAPVAASGVGTVASWIGGGGAGSYMAGLSAVGQAIGGNAILGAAILNGISIGTIGWGASSGLVLASKAALLVDLTLNGIAILNTDDKSNDLYIKINVPIPKDIGNKKVQELVTTIYNYEEEKNDALEDKNEKLASKLVENIENTYKDAEKLLTAELKNNVAPPQDDLIVLSIIAYKNGNYELFRKSMKNLEVVVRNHLGERKSFYYYLKGLEATTYGRAGIPKALEYFEIASDNENYVLEPIIAQIALLGTNFNKNKNQIDRLLEYGVKHYDSDKYSSINNLTGLYFKVATQYFNNGDFRKSIDLYEKSYDELGFFVKHLPIAKNLKNNIKIYIALAYKNLNEVEKANEIMNDIIEDSEGEEQDNFISMYYDANSSIVELGKKIYSKCAGCHGTNGKKHALGKSDIIKGKNVNELKNALLEYKSGKRSAHGMGSVMKEQVKNLTNKEIDTLSVYLSNLK